MDEKRSAPPPAHELPIWKRIGRALTRAVWPIAGAKDDPWLADDADLDPDLAHAEREDDAPRRQEEPAPEDSAPDEPPGSAPPRDEP